MIRKAAGIIIKDNRLLVVKSNRGDFFISPGGKYKEQESALECLSRELGEELNIRVTSVRHYKDYQEPAVYGDEVLHLETYFIEYEGTPAPASEIKVLSWAEPQEVLNHDNYASGLKCLVPDLMSEGHLTRLH